MSRIPLFMLFLLALTVSLGAVASAEEVPKWISGQQTVMEEELKALGAHAAKVAGALKRAEQAVSLAVSAGDQAAVSIAGQAADLARQEKTRVEEAMGRLQAMIGSLDRGLSRMFSKGDGQALPVIVTGDVQRRSGNTWEPATAATPIRKGEEIRTGYNGRVDLIFEDGSRLHLGPNSAFTYTGTYYQLVKGTLHNLLLPVPGATRGEVIRFRTNTAIIAVRGTEFDLTVDDSGFTHLRPWSGTVELIAEADGIARTTSVPWWAKALPSAVPLSAKNPRVASGKDPLSVALPEGYRVVLAAGSEFELAGQKTGPSRYELKKGKMYVSRENTASGASPVFILGDAVATPADGAFIASLADDGFADVIPLAGAVTVKASGESPRKAFWKE